MHEPSIFFVGMPTIPNTLPMNEKKFYLKPYFYITIIYGVLLSYLGYQKRIAEGGGASDVAWSILFSLFGTLFLGVFLSETIEKVKGNDGYGWAGIIGLLLLVAFFFVIVLFIPWIA